MFFFVSIKATQSTVHFSMCDDLAGESEKKLQHETLAYEIYLFTGSDEFSAAHLHEEDCLRANICNADDTLIT